MGNLKINGITPTSIYLGGSDVQKIYNGSELVWPPSIDPGGVEICNLIWTDVNSSETELIAGGNIPILTNQAEWYSAWQAQTPAACYRNFDSNNASYGLLYNYFAKDLVKPPLGFNLPTITQYNVLKNAPCYTDTGGGLNRYGENPGNWNLSQLTNTSELGDSGLNIQGNGYAELNTITQTVTFPNFEIVETHWMNVIVPGGVDGNMLFINSLSGTLGQTYRSPDNKFAYFIRFVKDA